MFKLNTIFFVSIVAIFSSTMAIATENTPTAAKAADVKGLVPTEFVTQTIDIQTGKLGAPVAMTYQIPAQISANEVIYGHLDFRSGTAEGWLTVEMNSDSGLILQSVSTVEFDLAAGPMGVDVQLLSTNDGLYYLNVTVKEYDTKGTPKLSRSFAVPIQVGSTVQQPKRSGNLIDDGKEKIIEMTAEELK